MTILPHHKNNLQVAEVVADTTIIGNIEDGLDLLGNLYYQDYDKIIVHEKNISPDFFDLKTGFAGELLQKFSNFRVRLAIVGDFTKYPSKSLSDFIAESNKRGQINFVPSVADALDRLCR